MIQPKILKALVYGANDGIVTTFAVVAGVAGAKLSASVVIIMGLANLFADGLSMGLGDYLGAKSEFRLRKLNNKKENDRDIWKTGVITFGAFLIAGCMPLAPYLIEASGLDLFSDNFRVSIGATLAALFVVGSARSWVTKDNWFRNGIEMLSVGAVAAGMAYGLGAVVEMFLMSS